MANSFDTWWVRQNDDQVSNTLRCTVDAETVRFQLAMWISKAYDDFEQLRRRAVDTGEKSLVFRAFASTGLLANYNFNHDDEISVLQRLPEKNRRLEDEAEVARRLASGEIPRSEKKVEDLTITVDFSSSDSESVVSGEEKEAARLQKQNVTSLRAACKKALVTDKGLKAALVTRLTNHWRRERRAEKHARRCNEDSDDDDEDENDEDDNDEDDNDEDDNDEHAVREVHVFKEPENGYPGIHTTDAADDNPIPKRGIEFEEEEEEYENDKGRCDEHMVVMTRTTRAGRRILPRRQRFEDSVHSVMN
jgi:hypothetical protein